MKSLKKKFKPIRSQRELDKHLEFATTRGKWQGIAEERQVWEAKLKQNASNAQARAAASAAQLQLLTTLGKMLDSNAHLTESVWRIVGDSTLFKGSL